MPNRPYSERFARGRGGGINFIYVCPAGYRAVVKSIDLHNFGGAGAVVNVYLAGAEISSWSAQGANAESHWTGHMVFYAGEALVLNVAGPDVGVHASGYVLADDHGPLVTPSPLPAEALERAAELR